MQTTGIKGRRFSVGIAGHNGAVVVLNHVKITRKILWYQYQSGNLYRVVGHHRVVHNGVNVEVVAGVGRNIAILAVDSVDFVGLLNSGVRVLHQVSARIGRRIGNGFAKPILAAGGEEHQEQGQHEQARKRAVRLVVVTMLEIEGVETMHGVGFWCEWKLGFGWNHVGRFNNPVPCTTRIRFGEPLWRWPSFFAHAEMMEGYFANCASIFVARPDTDFRVSPVRRLSCG